MSVNHDRRRSLQVVLQKCVAWDQEVKIRFVNYMCDEKLISEDEKNQIVELAEANRIERITKLITDFVFANKTIQKLLDFLNDVKVDTTVISLISSVVESELSISLLVLIEKWDKLVELENDIKEDITNLDPNYDRRDLDSRWPLNFICFCTKSENQEFLENLCDTGKIFQSLCGTSQKLEVVDEYLHDDEVSDEVHDDSPESFAIISDDDVPEDDYNIAAPATFKPDEFDESSISGDKSGVIKEEYDSEEQYQHITENEITKIGDVLKLVVKLLWPSDKKLTEAKHWPACLLTTIAANEELNLCRQFTDAVKCFLELKEECAELDFPSPTSLDVESAKTWISESLDGFLDFKKGVSVFNMLIQMAWPEVNLIQTNLLRAELIKKYELDETKTTDFVNILQVFHNYLKEFEKKTNKASGLPEEKDELGVCETEDADVPSGGSKEEDDTEKQHQHITENEITKIGDVLKLVVKLLWPSDKMLIEAERWPACLLATISANEEPHLCRQFTDVVNHLLELKEECADADFPSPGSLDVESAKVWISAWLDDFLHFKKGVSVYNMLIRMAWPEVKLTQIPLWKAELLKNYELDKRKTADFINILQVFHTYLKEFEEKASKASSLSEEKNEHGICETEDADVPPEKSREEDGTEEKQYVTETEIEKVGDVLKLIVKFLWKEDDELVEEESWPALLMATIADKEEPQVCHQFINVVRFLLELKKECSLSNFPTPVNLDVESAKGWISDCLDNFLQFKRGLHVFTVLYQMAWPNDESFPAKLLKTRLLENYALDVTKTTDFVNIANVFYIYLKEFESSVDATHTSLDEKEQTENGYGSSESNSDDGDKDVVKILIESVGDLLLPFIKLAWPEDPGLYDDEDWNSNLIATLCDQDNPELCQRFIEICEWILNLTKEGSGFTVMSSLECESAKNWISSASAEFLLSEERRSVFSLLFKLAWPNLELFPIERGPNILNEQYLENEEKAIDFVKAAQVFLELFKAYETRTANIESKENQHTVEEKTGNYDMNQEISFLESMRAEITQSRLVLLPFVKIFWPENDSIVDEEVWPEKLIAVASGSTDSSSKHKLLFIDICKVVLEIKQNTKIEAWPQSVDLKATRYWIITMSDRTVLSNKLSTHLVQLFHIIWPELGSVSIHGWTRALLEKYKCDTERAKDFVNAAQMFHALLKAQALIKTDAEDSFPSTDDIKENSKTAFLRDYYDEIDSAKEMLLPIVELMYSNKPEIKEDVNWPNELIATIVEDNEPNCEIIVFALQHILDVKKTIPEYAMKQSKLKDLKSVQSWFPNIVKDLNKFDEETPLFYKLYQLAWPNSNEEKIKARPFLKLCKNNLDRGMAFARAVEILHSLKQIFQEQQKRKKPKKSSKSISAITAQEATNRPSSHVPSEYLEAKGTDSAPGDQNLVHTVSQAQTLKKATELPACAQPIGVEKVKDIEKEVQNKTPIKKNSASIKGSKTAKHHSSGMQIRSQKHNLGIEEKVDDPINVPTTTKKPIADIAGDQFTPADHLEQTKSGYEIGDHYLKNVVTSIQTDYSEKVCHLQVSVPNLLSDIHVKVNGTTFRMKKYSNRCGGNIYGIVLPWQQKLEYVYFDVVKQRTRCEKISAYRCIYNPDKFIYDAAVWENSTNDTWDALMPRHLPSNCYSRGIRTFVHYWLKRIHEGWEFCDGSFQRVSNKKTEKNIILWLQTLSERDHVFGTLSFLLAMKNMRWEMKFDVLKNLLIGLQIDFLEVTQHDQLYRDILSEFVGDHMSTLDISCYILDVLNQLRDHEPIFLLALPLYLLVKHGHQVDMRTSKQFGKLTVLPCSRGEEELLKDLKLDVKFPGAKFLEKEYQKQLISLQSSISSAYKATPWIVAPYQRLLMPDAVANLCDTDADIANLFRLNWLLQDVVVYVNQVPKDKARILAKFQKHFIKMFQNAEEASREFLENDIKKSIDMMINMVTTLVKALKMRQNRLEKDFIFFCLHLTYSIARWSSILTKQSRETTSDKVFERIREIMDFVVQNIHGVLGKFKKNSIEACDRLFHFQFDTVLQYDSKQSWEQIIKETVMALIDQEWNAQQDEEYINFFSKEIMPLNLSRNLMYCFNEKAFICAQRLICADKTRSFSSFFCNLFGSSSSTNKVAFLEKLFLKEFRKYENIRELNETQQILKFICEWPMSTHFFDAFNKPSAFEYLPRAKKNIQKVVKVCSEFVRSLHDETIAVENLKPFWNPANRRKICVFFQCMQANKKESQTSKDTRIDALDGIVCGFLHRISCFRNEKEEVSAFISLCSSVKDARVQIECEELKNLYSISTRSGAKIKDFFTAEDIKANSEKYCGLTKQHLHDFQLMKVVKESNTLHSTWKDVAKKCRIKRNYQDEELFVLSWREALTVIWENVKSELCNLASSVMKGTITINYVVKIFEPVSIHLEELIKEMDKIFYVYRAVKSVEEHDIPLETLAGRVYDVFEISKNSMGLKWVLEFQEIQELDCDFKFLESILNTEKNTGVVLNDIDKRTLEKFPKEFRKMTNWNLEILQCFLNQKELIAWLKTTKMKDVSEMKVMCDLILASVGKTPIETDIVMHLLSAAQCFAPLLFHLDEVNSLAELRKRCKKVWSNVESDTKILQKWKDSGSQVRWFSEKESLYRSEQMDSLAWAQEINKRGVYTVGRLTEEHPTLANSVLLTLRPNMVELSPQKGNDTDRFTLDDLQDLQSKLALLAGEEDQGQQDIAQFVDLFTMVKTLAEAFINLTEAGCMLFSYWNAIITSSAYRTNDRQNENNLNLTIQFMKESVTLPAGIASLSVLQELSRTLRLTNIQWTDYISSKRLQHYYLNEYSMQQITYLCQQLASANNIASLPDQVLALLSNNSKNLVAGELQDALDEATKYEDTHSYDADIESENMEENERSLSELEKKKRAIRILMNNDDVAQDLATAAVQANGYESIDDCLTWAMLNEFDRELVHEKLVEYNQENAFALQSNEEEAMTSILHNQSNYSLTEMIAKILKASQAQEAIEIVGAVRTICRRYFEKTSTLTMRDYLSVDHLGKFLSILGGKGKLRTIVQRDIVSPLQSGKPNMILCSEAETLTILLSLYMTNQQQPLPTASEVLLCREQTSADEVERFMRRAMCKSRTNGKPLFCMAFTDKLKFKTSKALEDIFEKLQQQPQHLNEQYQLLFLTSSTQHFISDFFDKYHIQERPNHKNKTEILEYLLQHLSSDRTLTGSIASSVVQIVVSNRSGVGKSLLVKNLANQIDHRWYEGTDQTLLMQLFMTVLNRPEMPFVNRELPEPLKEGKANFVHCHQNDSLNVLLGIYMNNAKEPLPTTWEVLVCCQQTSEEEVERFFRRAMCKMQLTGERKQRCIFTLAFGERLQPKVAQSLKAIHEKLSGNMHCQKDYLLVMINGDIRHFDWCEKFMPIKNSIQSEEQNLSAYLHKKDVPEGAKLLLANIDQTATTNEDTSFPADMIPSGIWRKTTIRLLEKSVDTNHVLERLYREDHFRNEDNHFIHIDLTPAVEDGIECFMFNLLILGSIQDCKGRIWNRQKQHMYIVEMTKSRINKHQVHENSILNILPCITCLSPQETLVKLKNVKLETRTALKAHLVQSQEEADSQIATLRDCLNGDYEYSLDDFQHVQYNTRPSDNRVMNLLKLSGFPIQTAQQVICLLTEKLRARLENIYEEESLHTLFLMDYEEFVSTTFQRPYQYLKHASLGDIKLDNFQYCQPGGTQEDCIDVLLRNYVSPDPNWSQLKHFASFLNVQLENCEECVFCQKISDGQSGAYSDTELKGLKDFAVKFMIRMSQDFATPSLVIADQSGHDLSDRGNNNMIEQDVLDAHQLRRKWEEKSHPYVFFNEDRSMSFINVAMNRHGDLLDVDGKILVEKIADRNLVLGLTANHVKFGFNFHDKTRMEKLCVLRTIMGLPHSESDPDHTYELTTDNVLKILAIYMRLRCGIPVIVMGETGCGKTRMVEFMSKLRAGSNHDAGNMVTLKIHGGVVASDIYKSVEKAASIAHENSLENMNTVLFYDEANTTRAIYAIKEVICDNTINGISFHDKHLQIVAACNPYKRLSDKAIASLENSGLGYRVSASQTTDCLGEIPMRRLVYKVVALPPSMQPFVWDFGQLSAEIEKKYIDQMTIHLQKDLDLSDSDKDLIDFVFCAAQMYMKKNTEEECRYVSLRDVERCMKVFRFFHGLADLILEKIEKNLKQQAEKDAFTQMPTTLRCLIQTIGVCYHVSLAKGRAHFREHISQSLLDRNFDIKASALNNQLIACQTVFLRNIKLDNTIAPNEALRENVYLIAICCELQIPLFVVGKPGSSKSLAKTIVADNMRGKSSYSALFKNMKQVYTVSYQCSALTNASGIEEVFRQCADCQKKEDISTFSAVVVLDEIGLAEDSPNMPLKVLHPLLECGSTESGTIADLEPYQKVGFVGISNWALDPAKMNRGIFVTRSTPNREDLLATAKSIMKKESRIMQEEQEVLESLTKAYLDIYKYSQGGKTDVDDIDVDDFTFNIPGRGAATKEYFGLRDYYSLIKMVNSKSMKKEKCEIKDVAYAVQRNFSGGHESHFVQFTSAVQPHYNDEVPEEVSITDIIKDNLSEQNSRFLLLLTDQHSSLSLLQHLIPDFQKNVRVIFGSSFPGDHTYTEICKNINRIKTCMESGQTVVLLNLTEIHESLYDALNQHYMIYGGQRYVDIGLGSHRIKCRVSDNFRLIVMEHKDKVYREYPIPLINRLEKHHLTPQCLLSASQERLAARLSEWCKKYSVIKSFSEKDAFVGYHCDTPSSVVLSQNSDRDFALCRRVLLQSATIDTVYRALSHVPTRSESEKLLKVYTEDQVHDNLLNLLRTSIENGKQMLSLITVTSFSSILTETDRRKMEECLELSANSIMLMSLQQFDTQQEYLSRLEKFFDDIKNGTHSQRKILLIQCSQAERHGPLLSCARYCLMNMLKKLPEKNNQTIISFLLSTQRRHGCMEHSQDQLLLQHTEASDIIYVDELRPTGDANAVVSQFYGKTLTDILEMGSCEIKMRSSKGIQFLILLKESVCQAMAKLKRQKVLDDRYIKCIDCLTRLFDLDDEICYNFCFILSKHMKQIYLQRNQDLGNFVGDWKVKEACSAENLLEGGTFGKTLLLCLKRHLANLLAFIISNVDENNNLEVLYKYKNQLYSSMWEVELWLKLFEHYKMEWKNMQSLKEFSVHFNNHLTTSFTPCFPFSFKLNNFFDAQWSTNEDGSQDQRSIFNQFEDRHESKIIGHFYEEFESEMVDAYASDLIQCNFDYDETLRSLTKVLISISKKLEEELTQEEEFRNVRGIAIVYYSFRLYSNHLRMLHEIFKCYLKMKITQNIEDWIIQQKADKNFIIHSLAMKHLLEWVRKFSIEDDISCIEWMGLTSKCKKILLPNIHLITQPHQNEIRQIWGPISLLDLFLLQLLPRKEENDFKNYVKIVVNHSKRLHKPLRSFGFYDETFLKILLNVLRKSYEDIELKLLVSWQDLVCRMCRKKFSIPVKLPCGHFICEECVRSMLAAAEMRRQCPLCPTSIPQDFVTAPECLSTEAENKLKKFKSNCTSFFLEYLETFCFEDNMGPNNIRTRLILDEFVIGIMDDKPKLETRAIDMNISTKSCILQCLLRKDEEYTGTVINDLLQRESHCGDDSHRKNLILVILVGCEATLHNFQIYKDFKETWQNVLSGNSITIKMLSDIAKLRYTIQGRVGEVPEQWQIQEGKECEIDPELVSLIKLCKNDESSTLRKFAVKSGCQRFGMSWLNFVLGDIILENLVPDELKNETSNKLVDHFFLLGQNYADIREALDRGLEVYDEQTSESLSTREVSHEIISKILAAVKFPDDLQKLLQNINKGDKYAWLFSIMKLFDAKKCNLHTKQKHEMKELVVLTGCLALCQPFLMRSFCLLATNPLECEKLFLPAMPTSLFFSVQEALQQETSIAMYTCPNGHPYVIGECTKPWRESKCPECGEAIGGKLHVAAEKNQRIELNKDSEMGYQLNASDILGKDDPCDRMSKQGVAVVHCIIHCCMLIGLEHDTDTICRMLNEESRESSEQYICMKIWENILDLSNAIGRNCDDAVVIMHACLNNILHNGFDNEDIETDWNTMENRFAWEVQFRRLYLLPVFQDLDSTLSEAQQKLNKNENFGNSRLFRLTHEIAPEEQMELTWSHPALWRTIKHSNAAHLLQFIGDSSSAESVLKVILDTPGLEYLQHLEKVLELQRIFISEYQNTIDLKQAESITFAAYMNELEGFKNRKLVEKYIEIWNMIILKGFLQSESLPKEYLQEIDEGSPVAMALPSSRGRGKCAKLLAESLIDIHNNFLEKCSSITKASNGSNEVDVVQLLGANHFICIDKKKDLLPLIHMHTAYTITDGDKTNFGPQHKITYNVDALEKQIREKYVAYKPLINKRSLPCITYLQDIGIGTDWNRVIDNIPQAPLPSKLIQEVDALMAHRNVTPADICEGVRTLTHAISFLARIKTKASKKMQEYLKENLLLSPNHMAMIPKSTLISHTLALYQRLMWRKAVNFVQQGLNPYEEALSKADQEDIQDPEVLGQLKEAFGHMDMNLFQQRLNEILIKVPDYNPNWSLTECIFPEVEFIEGNNKDWYERIPQEICFKHISHLFQLAVKGISTTN